MIKRMMPDSSCYLCIGLHIREIVSSAAPLCGVAVIPAAVQIAEQPCVETVVCIYHSVGDACHITERLTSRSLPETGCLTPSKRLTRRDCPVIRSVSDGECDVMIDPVEDLHAELDLI